MGNSIGKLFRVTTWGESHGESIGVVIDGCPAGLKVSLEEVQLELDRRRPGQSEITSPRNEKDQAVIHSGLYEGITLGTPIAVSIKNNDQRKQDYSELKDVYRPSHADYTYDKKYGVRDPYGGGRSSARETAARVIAGVFAKKYLKENFGVEFATYVDGVHRVRLGELDYFPGKEEIESNAIRCPDGEVAKEMIAQIEQARAEGDSLGGTVLCRIRNVPIGLGEPVFDRLEADLAKAMLSIPATKGFDVGSGFAGTYNKGSENNDEFMLSESGIQTATNNSGGVQGGISNGEEIYFRVAFKPTSTIKKEQRTVNQEGQEIELACSGRHDPCVLSRAVPIVEAMAGIILVDHVMRQRAQNCILRAEEAKIN